MAKDTATRAPKSSRGGKIGSGRATPAQASAPTLAAAEKSAPKPRANPLRALTNFPQFMREVRAETRKITWPSRKETWITSVMVFIMLGITTLFFFVVDLVVGWGVGQVIKIGG